MFLRDRPVRDHRHGGRLGLGLKLDAARTAAAAVAPGRRRNRHDRVVRCLLSDRNPLRRHRDLRHRCLLTSADWRRQHVAGGESPSREALSRRKPEMRDTGQQAPGCLLRLTEPLRSRQLRRLLLRLYRPDGSGEQLVADQHQRTRRTWGHPPHRSVLPFDLSMCRGLRRAQPGEHRRQGPHLDQPSLGKLADDPARGLADLRGVSCGTPSLCVAVAREGRIFVSTNPTGGASAWQAVGTPGGPGDLEGVSCVATSLCAAGNASGNILTSTDPNGPAAGWSEANAGGSVQITGVSCPTALRCIAVDNNGDVLTSTDPTGGASSWHFENLVPYGNPPEYQGPGNALFGASCASISLCALVGSEGRIFISTEPFSKSVDPLGSSKHHKVRKRPKTILLFAKPFWESKSTRRRHIRARFHFFSQTATQGFECKRDRGRFRRCHSPLRYWVGHGRHALRVRAIGPTGLRGPVAIKRFRVTRPRAAAS